MTLDRERQKRRKDWLAALGLSVLAGCCIAFAGPPILIAPLGFLAPPLLLLAIERAPPLRPGRAFLAGLLAGFVSNTLALHWIVGLLQVFAHFPLALAIPVAALLWAAQALPYAFTTLFAGTLRDRGAPGWLVLPACLVVAESLCPALFPWRPSATQIPWTAWIQLAEIGGDPLLDGLLALGGCAMLEALRTRRRWPMVLAATAILGPALYGALRIHDLHAERDSQPRLRVGVVQPNIGIFEKHDSNLWGEHLALLHEMSAELEQQGADIIVWPETAYPFPFPRGRARDLPPPFSLRGPLRHAELLAGTITRTPEADRYNSALAIDSLGEITGTADKVQLLAFGEYVPLWDWLPPLQKMFRSRGIIPGDVPRMLQVGGARVGVLNCYEDILSSLTRIVARQDPQILVNITNDAWFGDTSEPYLHQHVARLRTVETRRELVRAVNTGVSSHTLVTGEDAIRTESWTRTSFIADARLYTGTTPWLVLGDWVTPTLLALLLTLAVALSRRRVEIRAT